MRRLQSIADEMNGVVTYELPDGRRVCFDRHSIEKYGLAALASHAGIDTTEIGAPMPVEQRGRMIGHVPADFDPLFIKSTSWLYNPRPNDFVRKSDRWVASDMLGPGDLEAVPGFVWDRRSPPVQT